MDNAAGPSTTVQVDKADTVNVPGDIPSHIPYVKIIAWVSFFVLIAFAAISGFILYAEPGKTGIDAATKGSIIQTWNNLAIMAATFWVGSSLGGKLASGTGKTSQ